MVEPQLNEIEVRVLSALVEKSVTTPDNYPLSLNALVNACNQKSNRYPVMELDSATVGQALASLRQKGLARIIMGGDSRVPKYQHYFEEAYHLTQAESAILCELMLRGPQTVGELRGRIERFNVTLSLPQAEEVMNGLASRPEPLVMELPRTAGRREVRFAHLLAGEPSFEEEAEPAAPRLPRDERLAGLEEEVARLRRELDEFREELADFKRQFE
ncbi:MAG: YceH family protein [Armatimonadota bacterium]